MNIEDIVLQALHSHDRMKIEKAFETVYNEYNKLIHFVIGQYVNNESDIEDLVNDVFLSFFNHLATMKVRNIKYYLTVSAKNYSLNFIKRKKETIIDISHISNIPISKNQEIYYLLKRTLNEDEYQIILEHVIYGKTLKQLSIELNINSNTLKSKYLRAINKLKEELEV